MMRNTNFTEMNSLLSYSNSQLSDHSKLIELFAKMGPAPSVHNQVCIFPVAPNEVRNNWCHFELGDFDFEIFRDFFRLRD